jgi:hypothetical protein
MEKVSWMREKDAVNFIIAILKFALRSDPTIQREAVEAELAEKTKPP